MLNEPEEDKSPVAPKPTREATFERNKRFRAAELQKKMVTDNTAQTTRFERMIKH
jgi:hypothetical protein